MLRAVIFDLDGVLLESMEAKTQAFWDLFADYPVQVNEIVAYHAANGGVSRFEKFRHIFDEILKQPLSEERFRFLCDRYSDLVLTRVLESPLVPGAEAFLREFSRDLLLFVVSGTPSEELALILEKRGLARHFRGAFGSPGSKSEIVKNILTDWSLASGETVLVGDSQADLQAAHANGIRFIGRRHIESPPAWETRPDLVTVRDLIELRAELDLCPSKS